MKLLNKFYADFQVKAEVKAYLIEYLSKRAVENAFIGKPTTGFKEAKDCIDSAFRDLDKMYGEKPKRGVTSSR